MLGIGVEIAIDVAVRLDLCANPPERNFIVGDGPVVCFTYFEWAVGPDGRMTGHYELLVPDADGIVLLPSVVPRAQLTPASCPPLLSSVPTDVDARAGVSTPIPHVLGSWCTPHGSSSRSPVSDPPASLPARGQHPPVAAEDLETCSGCSLVLESTADVCTVEFGFIGSCIVCWLANDHRRTSTSQWAPHHGSDP